MNKLFKSLPHDQGLLREVIQVETDNDLGNLGFECKGQLCEYKGYEGFNERLWLWVLEDEDCYYTVVASDLGNTYCTVVMVNVLIEELEE